MNYIFHRWDREAKTCSRLTLAKTILKSRSIRNVIESHPKLYLNLMNDDYEDILMILTLLLFTYCVYGVMGRCIVTQSPVRISLFEFLVNITKLRQQLGNIFPSSRYLLYIHTDTHTHNTHRDNTIGSLPDIQCHWAGTVIYVFEHTSHNTIMYNSGQPA